MNAAERRKLETALRLLMRDDGGAAFPKAMDLLCQLLGRRFGPVRDEHQERQHLRSAAAPGPHVNFYDRNGRAISTLAWAKLCEQPGYRDIARTRLPNGVLVSTVWLGNDMNFFRRSTPPIIFETMVFRRGSLSAIDVERYATWAHALDGHRALVDKWLSRTREQVRRSRPKKNQPARRIVL